MSVQSYHDGAVARVCFADPKANCLSSVSLHALEAEFRSLSASSVVKVIGFESEGGGAFCAGASFSELQSVQTEDEAGEFFLGFAKVILAMRDAPQFIVSRVHGKAVGGALGLIAASDYVFANKLAEVRLSELNLGIGPFVIGPAVERKIGKAAFSHLSIDTEFRSAEWALEKNLYSRICENTEDLDEQYRQELIRLSEKSSEAQRGLKQMFWEGTADWPRLFQERAKVVARLLIQNRR